MSSALVVHESYFGNNKALARAVGDGLAEWFDTRVVSVARVPQHLPTDVDLLVVAAPNHSTGLPDPASREEAVRFGAAPVPAGQGLREWISAQRAQPGVLAAAFDTRLDQPKVLRVLDRAARVSERLLSDHGFELITPAVHFQVTGVQGPLAEGELERARAWGLDLAQRVRRQERRRERA